MTGWFEERKKKKDDDEDEEEEEEEGGMLGCKGLVLLLDYLV